MTVSRLTCPECQTVLRPAKPLPEGKPVKCPECGARFAAGGGVAVAPAPTKRPAAAPKKPTKAPAGPAKKKDADDDDDGGGVYSFAEDGGPPPDPKKLKIEYAPDMSIKDLRGPAQAAVIPPTNMVIRSGVLSFLGWIALLVIVLIPVIFPLPKDEKNKSVVQIDKALGAVMPAPAGPGGGPGGPGGAPGGATDELPEEAQINPPPKPGFWNLFGLDLSRGGETTLPFFFLIFLLPIFMGMAYTAVMTFGAVKMQNLESYGWGMAASIMALFPIYALGFAVAIVLGLQSLFLTVLADPWYAVQGIIIGATVLAAVGGGLWALLTQLSEDVVRGFEYKPE